MQQTGKVIDILKDNKARVMMTKHTACGDCGACQHGRENMNLSILAVNEVHAQVGDMVEVSMETQNVLGSAFIAYVIPLITMIVGVLIGNQLLPQIGYDDNIEIYSALIGFLLMAASFIIIKQFEGRFEKNKNYVPIIVSVITNNK